MSVDFIFVFTCFIKGFQQFLLLSMFKEVCHVLSYALFCRTPFFAPFGFFK